MNKIGKQIKKIREEKNLSQERFGFKIGVTGKTISSYERGRSIPPLRILEQISEVYNVPLVKVRSKNKSELNDKILQVEETIKELKKLINSSLSF